LRDKQLGRKVLLGIAIAGIAYFAVQGGEYGTLALVRQHFEKRALRRAIDSLQHAVDSLGKVKQAVASDPAVQERIAREEFGMIKQKELLYRFAGPEDTAGARKQP
jgi:cell division protein FtsB